MWVLSIKVPIRKKSGNLLYAPRNNYYTSFQRQCYLIVFHWSLSDSKSPQVSRTLLSIRADLNDAVVWMVSILPLISKTFGRLSNPLVTAYYYYYYYFTLWEFFIPHLMVSHRSLSDSKSLSILADLNNTVVWTVSTRPLICKSSSPSTYPLVTVSSAPITIDIIVTFMFHSFFNSLARSRYLFFCSFSFSFTLWSAGTAKFTIRQVLFFVDSY